MNIIVDGSLLMTKVVAATAAVTLSPFDSGCLVTVSQAAAYTITLPVVLAGLRYRFFLKTSAANAVVVKPAANAQITGSVYSISASNVCNLSTGSGSNQVNFVASGGVGDVVDAWCDGNLYYVWGMTSVAAKLTIS